MDVLPSELYHEIASYFRFSAPRRTQPWDLWYYESIEYFLDAGRIDFDDGSPDVETLSSLRLTSKTFNQAATPVLFRSLVVFYQGTTREEGPYHHAEEIVNALVTPEKTFILPSCVKTLNFLFTDVAKGFGNAVRGPIDDSRVFPPVETAIIERTIKQIPPLLENTSSLESLRIRFPGWESELSSNQGLAPLLDIETLSKLTTVLASTLSTQPFDSLTDLRLILPCTHDFVILAKDLPDRLLSQLKAIELGVTDATGPGGAKEYLLYADDDDDGDDEFPFSNLQLEYCNTDHMDGIFSIVSRCPNLETLCLLGTQFLDADLLNWAPTSSGLRNLILKRVKISANQLIALLSPSSDPTLGKSSITKIWLEYVHLTDGFWSEVFEHLLLCPSLEYCNFEELCYLRATENAQFRMIDGRPWEDTTQMQSSRQEDEAGMYAVRDHMIELAGSEEAYESKFGDEYGFPLI